MWFRAILTAFALAVVLYLQFGFDLKDWIKHSSSAPISENTAAGAENDPVHQP